MIPGMIECSLTTLSTVTKTAIGDLERAALRREYNNYQVHAFASNRYIRTMYEAIGSIESSNLDTPSHLVFEYMDTIVREVPSDKFRGTNLPRNLSKSILLALEVMRSQRKVHTGKITRTTSQLLANC